MSDYALRRLFWIVVIGLTVTHYKSVVKIISYAGSGVIDAFATFTNVGKGKTA